MRKERFNITGMTCSACSARVERTVAKMTGTADVSVNLLTNRMSLTYDENVTSPAAIIAAVEEAGYGASVKGASAAKQAQTAAPAYGGQGIARRLIEEIIAAARREGRKIVPVCSYAAKMMQGKDEYSDVLARSSIE